MKCVISLPTVLKKFQTMSGVSDALFMAQQVLTGSQKGRQKSSKGENALHFLGRLELAIL